MIFLGVGWIHFHETTPTYPKKSLVMGFVSHIKGHAIAHK
jgi:hypothetical protein